MKRAAVVSLAAATILNASGINDAFAAGKADGEIRMAHISQKNETSTDTYTAAVSGIVKYETAGWNSVRIGVGAYLSQKLGFVSGTGEELNYDVLSAGSGSYGYVGEAYVEYASDGMSIRAGRQQIDTPFADTDDIRMHPNTFEAVVAAYVVGEETNIIGGYVTRWAGYDSGGKIDEFKKLGEESNGAAIFGVTNESIENLAAQGWYYSVDNMAEFYYADATYRISVSEEGGVELSAQYAHFKEKSQSGMDGSVYGIGAAFTAGAVTVGVACNRGRNEEGKTSPIGFGGGPYLTSMEEWTIEGMEDVKAHLLNVELDMERAGIEGLTLSGRYGSFKSAPADTKVIEIDVIAAYEISEALWAEVSYAKVVDRNDNADDGADAGFSRLLARLSYNF